MVNMVLSWFYLDGLPFFGPKTGEFKDQYLGLGHLLEQLEPRGPLPPLGRGAQRGAVAVEVGLHLAGGPAQQGEGPGPLGVVGTLERQQTGSKIRKLIILQVIF